MQQQIITIAPLPVSEKKTRAAAYVRVSTNKDDQLNSFAAQYIHYKKLLEESISEELVDVYADEGISGTTTKERDAFNKLISDCEQGKIDRIYTKSISRFARNTTECLKYVRYLKSLGVTIYFEKENLDTANEETEFRLTMLESHAQEESISISKNVRLGEQYRMERGEYLLKNTLYGYDLIDHQLVINEEEAEVVRRIYRDYTTGKSLLQIIHELNEEQIPKHGVVGIWSRRSIPSNIRGLRKTFGESITDLALAIGVGNTAVSNYELGDRIPDRDVLKRIAKHYHITENELVHGDYSNMKPMYNDTMLDQQYNINMMEKMLPGICSPRALENNNFKQAYLLDEKIFNCIINQNYDLSDEDMEKCFEYYFAAIDEKVIEASANLLRQIFLVGMITCWMNPKFMDAFDGIKESPKKLVQAMYLTSYDDEADSKWLQQREEFLEEYELHIVLNIYRLKHSAEYADLGDFYMALRYIFGMVRNGNSPELNSAIGYQMMSEFSMLGNIYADKFSTK